VNRAQLPNLTVNQLDYLVAAVDSPTWAVASERLGVTQSALSQGISELQRRLGVEVFERHGRRRVPHPRATPVIAHARAVLAQTTDLAAWASDIRSGRGGRLRIGMIDAAAVNHFGDTLRQFRMNHPNLDLHLTVGPSSQLLASLSDGGLDLAVCVDPSHGDFETTRLLEEPLVIYAPQGATIGDPSTWGPWVSFPSGSLTRRLIASALASIGAEFDVIAESHQPEVLREMVHLGMGWTVLPPIQAERDPRALTRAVDSALLTRDLVAVRRRSALPDAAAAALTALMVSALA
jgi:DNA-binding transcriptional LysR family regulator